MTGYNHYPNCTCGWCVGGYRPIDTGALREEAARLSASEFLRRNGARRLGSTCFVSPNATCPVCKASVYFYANASGSRVFFDELGPPWPKHPCTDRPQVSARVAVYAQRPARRTAGDVKEIISKGFIVDRARVPDISRADRPKLDSWRLLVITAVRERPQVIELEADFVETIFHHHITLTGGTGHAFYAGQFVSLRYDVLSFFDENRGHRQDVQVSYSGVLKGSDGVPQKDVLITSSRNFDQFGLPASLKTEGLPGPVERAHYLNADPKSEFFEELKRLIQAAAKSGAVYLADFEIALKDSGMRTLKGQKWSRQVVSAVIFDMRNEADIPRYKGSLSTRDAYRTSRSKSANRVQPPLNLHPPTEVQKFDQERTKIQLGEIEGAIRSLELAWDAALTPAQRQKIRDQLDSKRKLRAKLIAMISF